MGSVSKKTATKPGTMSDACVGMRGEAGLALEKDAASALGPFTALSAEGGRRPGIYAGLEEQGKPLGPPRVLSAAFTRLLRATRQEPGEPG